MKKRKTAADSASQPLPRGRPTQRAAFEAAKAALAAQGLAMTPFGIDINERVVAGELSDDEAMAALLEYHRPPSADASSR